VPEEDPLAKTVPTEVKNFVARLNEWRSGSVRGRPIPEALWLEAGRLAGSYGIGFVADAAGLNQGKVKARMAVQDSIRGRFEKPQAKELVRSAGKPSPFVEIPMHATRPSGNPMVVELRNSQGGFIRVEQGSGADILMLMHAFLGRSS
jgi:hypothetical protein